MARRQAFSYYHWSQFLRDWNHLGEVTMHVVTEDDAVRIVRAYLESLFPKVCPKCGTRFDSLRDYLRLTTHLGSPNFYETAGGLADVNPLGPIAHATCGVCGNTLTIGSEGIPKAQLMELIEWAKADARRRSIRMNELLRQLRDRIDEEVLRNDDELAAPRRRRFNDLR